MDPLSVPSGHRANAASKPGEGRGPSIPRGVRAGEPSDLAAALRGWSALGLSDGLRLTEIRHNHQIANKFNKMLAQCHLIKVSKLAKFAKKVTTSDVRPTCDSLCSKSCCAAMHSECPVRGQYSRIWALPAVSVAA